jgi:hypothetical protein
VDLGPRTCKANRYDYGHYVDTFVEGRRGRRIGRCWVLVGQGANGDLLGVMCDAALAAVLGGGGKVFIGCFLDRPLGVNRVRWHVGRRGVRYKYVDFLSAGELFYLL